MGEQKKPPSAIDDIGCIAFVILILVLFIGMVISESKRPPDPHSDDPWYDAPTGRTRGGDTY